MTMLRNWITLAIRNLTRHKLYTAINVLGLAIGLAAAMLILIFVRHELSYDDFFTAGDRIHQVYARNLVDDGRTGSTVQAPVAPLLAESVPEVERAVRVANRTVTVLGVDGPRSAPLTLVDSGFFALFDFPFARGVPQGALDRPDAVVLTPRLAERFFGDADPVGRTLRLEDGVVLQVTGVLAEPPSNTHLRFEMLANYRALPDMRERMDAIGDEAWNNSFLTTYVLLRPGSEATAVEAGLPALLREKVPGYGVREERGEPFSLHLHPLRQVHANPVDERDGVSPGLIVAFIAIAVMMLALAGINFVNLSTARASLRAKEVALRKTFGARRGALVVQFLGESVLLALLGGVVAIAIVEHIQPLFLAEIGLKMGREFHNLAVLAWTALALALLVGVLGGLYPALVLSRFSPARILRGAEAGASGKGRLRAALVVGQFAMAILFLVATAVTVAQTQHARNARLGFDKENVVLLRGLARPAVAEGWPVLRDRLAADPDVLAVSAAFAVPGDFSTWTSSYEWEGRRVSVRVEQVHTDYLSALGIPLLAGRGHDTAQAHDTAGPGVETGEQAELGVMISRSAVAHLGFDSPEAAVGRDFLFALGPKPLTARIIGVTEDVQYSTVRRPLMPTVYLMKPDKVDTLIVRIRPGSMPGVAQRIDGIWQGLFPDFPVRRHFLDDRIDALYAAEEKQALFLSIFAGLAILIACLGLFGLAAFTAERRTKEIGVRKVLGAGTADIVGLLVWQFSRPVILANLIAWPLAWLVMSRWLETYAYRIELGPLFFLLPGGAALLIAWITVAGHAARVARARPVTALRYE